VQLTVGVFDGRHLVVTVEEDGRELDAVVGFILTSLSSIFPAFPTEYVYHETSPVAACFFCAFAMNICKSIMFSRYE